MPQAGEQVLKQCVFTHVSRPEDKVALLAAMIVKLWGLVRGLCCEDSADSALHQEVLLPGHLFCKALHERLSVWLSAFAQQVRPLLRAQSLEVATQAVGPRARSVL